MPATRTKNAPVKRNVHPHKDALTFEENPYYFEYKRPSAWARLRHVGVPRGVKVPDAMKTIRAADFRYANFAKFGSAMAELVSDADHPELIIHGLSVATAEKNHLAHTPGRFREAVRGRTYEVVAEEDLITEAVAIKYLAALLQVKPDRIRVSEAEQEVITIS